MATAKVILNSDIYSKKLWCDDVQLSASKSILGDTELTISCPIINIG